MEWGQIEKLKDWNSFKIPENWLFIHYYEALNILFRFENILRIFVFIVLKNEYKEKWFDLSITSDESDQSTIKALAKKRISQASSFGYLGYNIASPIMHLTSGELIHIITSDNYWKHFKQYFPGSKDIIKNKLEEINSVRNSLAHFRPIKNDDVEAVKQNAKHVLMLIEEMINEMLTCQNIVPTNTKDEWYTELKTLGTDNCFFVIFQSKNEQWINIKLIYQCAILHQQKNSSNYITYKVLNIKTSKILHKYPNLQNIVTFMYEYVPYTNMNEELKPNFNKIINFLFNKKTLVDNHSQVKSDLEKLLLDIASETDIIKQDNYANGEIVNSISSTATFTEYADRQSGYWKINTSQFDCQSTSDDPSEYWGNIYLDIQDFMGKAHKFPWMPVDISFMYPPF